MKKEKMYSYQGAQYVSLRILPANQQTEQAFPGFADTASTGYCSLRFRLSRTEIVRLLFVITAAAQNDYNSAFFLYPQSQ